MFLRSAVAEITSPVVTTPFPGIYWPPPDDLSATLSISEKSITSKPQSPLRELEYNVWTGEFRETQRQVTESIEARNEKLRREQRRRMESIEMKSATTKRDSTKSGSSSQEALIDKKGEDKEEVPDRMKRQSSVRYWLEKKGRGGGAKK